MCDVVDISSQVDETMCTLLHDINNHKVDVGKETIVKPKHRMLHNQQMPHGVVRVYVASVKAAFKDFPPPIPIEGDDKTLKRIGACNSWFLPWLKTLLHVEAPGSTPTTMPQQGMNTTHLCNYVQLSWQVIADDARENLRYCPMRLPRRRSKC